MQLERGMLGSKPVQQKTVRPSIERDTHEQFALDNVSQQIPRMLTPVRWIIYATNMPKEHSQVSKRRIQ